ncbi:MAG: SDR family oxidoreductase [Armatimonadota bacterium]|nr:SDR family oxidoreductase [Armatimonadota bacterium]
MMKVLVTGGAGFIGSHLVESLVRRGYEVRVMDNLSTGKIENLSAVRKDIEFLESDLRDFAQCKNACVGVEKVWHLGALGSVPRSVADPLTTHEVNLTGTLHMLLAARDAGVERFVFASSSSVYGANPELPREESQHPMPMSPYANTKLAAETYVRQFAALYGLQTVSLRYFNVYGPRQDPTSQYAAVVPRFFSALLSGRRPVIYGDGEQTREFTFVYDCVEATIAAGLVEPDGVVGEHFNIAAGSPHSVNELLSVIQRVLGTQVEPEYAPPRPGDVKCSDASVEKAAQRLGFRAKWSLEDGIAKTAEWYLVMEGRA